MRNLSPKLGLVQPSREAPDETDVLLVAAVRRRDLGAAGRLYDRYATNVHGMIYRLLGPHAELDDIVQEVFIYALSSIDKLREPSALKSWLLGIAVGKVRTHLRSRFRKRWLSFLPNEDLPEPSPISDDEDGDVVHAVSTILDRLPNEERIALVVHRLEGMSIQESATACGLSISTFKRRFARGEAKFIAQAQRQPVLAHWLEGSRP